MPRASLALKPAPQTATVHTKVAQRGGYVRNFETSPANRNGSHRGFPSACISRLSFETSPANRNGSHSSRLAVQILAFTI